MMVLLLVNCILSGMKSEFGWAIGQLDDYEGVSVESDEIQLFRRELVDVIIRKVLQHQHGSIGIMEM